MQGYFMLAPPGNHGGDESNISSPPRSLLTTPFSTLPPPFPHTLWERTKHLIRSDYTTSTASDACTILTRIP